MLCGTAKKEIPGFDYGYKFEIIKIYYSDEEEGKMKEGNVRNKCDIVVNFLRFIIAHFYDSFISF